MKSNITKRSNIIWIFTIMAFFSYGLSFCIENDYKVLMYWDSVHSFTENEHSLANWLTGGTANAAINSNGEIEMKLDISGIPHVLSSPELNILTESFDAVKIVYQSLLEYNKEKNPEIAVILVDEILAEKYSFARDSVSSEDINYLSRPMKSNMLTIEIFNFKEHIKWKENIKIKGINIAPRFDSDALEGKLIISSIELVKF